MTRLDRITPYPLEAALADALDETVLSPLWDWPVMARPLVLSERRRRGLILDDEPTGDPEFS